jgi:hypothetical protein
MGGRIPKSAQKAIDKANQQRRLFQITREAAARSIPVPRVMATNVTPRHIANLFDVYFNDELQLLCTLANVDKGMIRRYTSGFGNRPDKGSPIEELYGKVEIRRKTL